jgi:2',3'-cyclic-nucleotide 2'-phosphodiesterase (5'-nucleotidase family)
MLSGRKRRRPVSRSAFAPPRPAGVPETVPAVLRLEAGGVRVGVVALAPPWPVPAGQGGGGGEGSEEAVWAAVESRLRELRAGSDLVVVLSQRGLASDRALAQRAGRSGASSPPAAGLIDLLIGNAEARSLTAPEVIGRTWLLPTSERGQEVGRVDVTFTDAGPSFNWRRIPLDRTFGPEPVVEGIVGAYYAAQAQRLLDASLGGVGEPSGLAHLPAMEPEGVVGRAYVPAAKCAGNVIHRNTSNG